MKSSKLIELKRAQKAASKIIELLIVRGTGRKSLIPIETKHGEFNKIFIYSLVQKSDRKLVFW
jgi:hypothetical protein